MKDMMRRDQENIFSAEPDAAPKQQSKLFEHYLPGSVITPESLENIPPQAVAALEEQSQYLVRFDNYRPGNFEKLFVISHADASKTYVGVQTKTYGDDGDTERLMHLIDVGVDDQEIGHGEVRLHIDGPKKESAYFKDKPFVGGTNTEDGSRGKGLGMRRLRMMNALTHMQYNLPLHSDTLQSPEAKRLWEKLVAEGAAKKYREEVGKNERYMFIDVRR